MKTAEEVAKEFWDQVHSPRMGAAIIKKDREAYGALVREEAANQVKELLIHPSPDSPDWMALADQMLEGAIDAIRKMELP